MKIPEEIRERLYSAARTAQRRAYAPYSKFHVGAAFYTDRGRIVSGCNVENASYGLTVCAERNAIGSSVVQRSGKPIYLVVVGPSPDFVTPCGACRQVLREFNPDLVLACYNEEGDFREHKLVDLLPHSFGPEHF